MANRKNDVFCAENQYEEALRLVRSWRKIRRISTHWNDA